MFSKITNKVKSVFNYRSKMLAERERIATVAIGVLEDEGRFNVDRKYKLIYVSFKSSRDAKFKFTLDDILAIQFLEANLDYVLVE